jgi:hypothetical protein
MTTAHTVAAKAACRRSFQTSTPSIRSACGAAGVCYCVCMLIIIVVGSLVGTVAQTTNAKLLQFVASFDELCNVQNDAIASSFHIELDNPSSIGVSVNPFTLQIRHLVDNMDTSDGTLAMELTLPAIDVPGGEGVIDFATDVKLVDVPLCQRIASEFLSQKPVVILLKAAVPVKALGLGTTVDVAFPFYLNNTMRDPNAEPPTSLEFAKFVSDDIEKLVLDLGLRVNGSERFIAKVPPMSIAARYTDKEQAQGPVDAIVAQVNTQPFTFKQGWNYFNFTTTVPSAERDALRRGVQGPAHAPTGQFARVWPGRRPQLLDAALPRRHADRPLAQAASAGHQGDV